MRRLLPILAFALPTLLFADDPKPPAFVVHTGHFEKNTSGLKGDASLLLIRDDESFGKLFGTIPAAGLGGGFRKNNPVTKDVFEQHVVAAVVKRGKAITTYIEVSTKADGDTLTVAFKSEAGKPGGGTFASPLVVSVPKGTIAKVVFVENGKEIGTAK